MRKTKAKISCSMVLTAALAVSAPAMAGPDEASPSDRLLVAWESFCDALKSAGSQIIERSGDSEIDAVEGFRYLAMLAGLGIERTLYYDDPQNPVLARNLDTFKKLGLESSDNTYRMVSFEPGGTYRIRGWRRNSTYLGIQINAGRGAVGNMNNDEMQFNDDGSFEIYLGGERQGRNWIELPPNADNLYVREVFIDWDTELPSLLWFERLDKLEPPAPVTAAAMEQKLQAMSRFASDNVAFWDRYVSGARERNFNQFAMPSTPTAEGASADNTYSGGWFSVAAREALIVEVDVVDALFWNIQLGNRWFQSLDYQHRQTSLNNHQALADDDGRYRFVISHEDPGVANWLDTAGHDGGVMYLRWNQAETAPGKPRVTKVMLDDLDRSLPATTPRVSAAERAEILRRRYEAVARRFAL